MKSYGYLKYDPRYDKVQGKPTKYNDWWLILKVNYDLAAYYQWWLQKEATWPLYSVDWLQKAELNHDLDATWAIVQRGIKVHNSAWGPHISIIRGEKPKTLLDYNGNNLWGKYQDQKIWFEFEPDYLNTNGKHWWIRVISPDLERVRTELGLTPQPIYFHRDSQTWQVNPFHLTIGHMLN